MRLRHDPTADALYLLVHPGKVARTVPLDDSRIVDYDCDGNVLGYEFLGVSSGLATSGIPRDVIEYIQRRQPWVRMVAIMHGGEDAPQRRAHTTTTQLVG